MTTRIPRERSATVAAEDYLHVAADGLTYDGAARRATYRGGVSVRIAEGWLEAGRLELELAEAGGEVREVRAFDRVEIEFQERAEGLNARPIAGTADRAVYEPAHDAVRLFGDRSPATVRRIGEGGGTTTGRVLLYRMDSGQLEVDAGEQGPARILTQRN